MNIFKLFFTLSLLSVTFFVGHFVVQEYIFGENNKQLTDKSQLPKEIQELENIDEIINMDYFNNKSELENDDYFAILILGLDDNSFEGSRTDSIMIAIVNKESDKISLVSIPRDLRVELFGMDRYDKVNSAFAYGGIDLSAATIEKEFGIPIHYYSVINFQGFEDLVDSLGGIELYVEKDLSFHDRITNSQFSLSEGSQNLNGIEALNYSRYRGDAEGDFGRMRRQQQTMSAIVNETLSFRSIPKITNIFDSISSNYESNINFTDMSLLALKFRNLSSDDLEIIPFESKPTARGGVSYVEADDEELELLRTNLKRLLTGKDIISQ